MQLSELYRIFQERPHIITDSRQIEEGAIFLALKGEHFDGNQYARQAIEQGCAYAVIDEPEYDDPNDDRIILVDDCLATLQALARLHRRTLGTHIIGVTGTNGKTTTKELIATVLGKKYDVLFTEGNLNNHIGVPKTLLRLRPEHDMAVVEMGANHPGEIKTLVNIAEPDYGIITNVGMAHLEGFGSFEGVVRTKGELYDFLRQREDSVVFIHHENEHLHGIAQGLHLVEYGTEGDHLYVEGRLIACDPYLRFEWRKEGGEWHTVATQLIGAYNLYNMLAAACIGCYHDVEAHLIDEALGNYRPTNNRSQMQLTEHNRLVVDTYNANPTSMKAALDNFVLMDVKPKMVILGSMGELGAVSEEEHRKVVKRLEEAGFEQVWLVGKEFGRIPCAFRKFADVEEVKAELEVHKPEGFCILIKGSNSTKLFQLPPYL